MAKQKILLTAFCGTSAELLVRDMKSNSQYKILYLSNDKKKDSELLIGALKQETFDTVISLGQRPNIKDKVHIETRACKGNERIETAFDCKRLKVTLEQAGLVAKFSDNAGTSFCNELYWNGLKYIEENELNTKMVFVHVPFLRNIGDIKYFGEKLLTGIVYLTYLP